MIVYDKLHWLKAPVVNAFLFAYEIEAEAETETAERFILVDTGMRGRPQILPYLARLGHAPDAITHIFVTHADVDHAGNLAAVQQATGATVITGEQSAALLVEGQPPSHGQGFVSKLSERFGTYPAVPEQCLQTVQDGDILPLLGGMHVIATPGHTADHHAFYLPAHGIVFAGDALASTAGGFKLNAMVNADNDLAAVSAMKLLDLTPVIFACGHGTPTLHTIEQVEAFFATLRQA